MKPGVVLVATLGGSYKAAVTAILDKDPEFVWFICTKQSILNIAAVKQELVQAGFAVPVVLGSTETAHDDLIRIYQDAVGIFKALEDKKYVIYLDLTSGTVPMSLGTWEASKEVPDIIVSWIDNVAPPRIHVLSIPKTSAKTS